MSASVAGADQSEVSISGTGNFPNLTPLTQVIRMGCKRKEEKAEGIKLPLFTINKLTLTEAYDCLRIWGVHLLFKFIFLILAIFIA